MKKFFRKTLSLLLACSLVLSLGLSAAASEAMGEDLTGMDTLLHQETRLSTNTFWSTAYNDLRTENLITYTPNTDVTPIVTYGQVLTDRNTVTATARELEDQGYRVVAGINGDFYNVNTGLPIGLVVTAGQLRCSDGGYYAVGFRADGTAVIGKPGVKAAARLGYPDAEGYGEEVSLQLAGVNKARVAEGGVYLYTYDFNTRHTTGNTEAGVDVVCTVQEGRLSIGETMTAVVERVEEASAATEMGPDQIVLSANLKSDPYYVETLRNIPAGAVITLEAAAASEEWNDVEYAVGALYSLVADGAVVAGLPTGTSPRTAVGVRYDGTVVFYTIDGRRAGHSVGASMDQVAKRMIELGCYAALCLDGGGSTTLSITAPDKLEANTANRPSDGAERKVSNQVFLVASNRPTGELSHFYVQADNQYVLAGSKVHISASAVDTGFIPMEEDYRLSTDAGELDGNVLTTPSSGGEVTVTAGSGRRTGSTTVHAVATPDDIAIRNGDEAITALQVVAGSATQLRATAAYQHKTLKADPEAFTWTVDGDIGTVDERGVFTASMPGEGTITVSAGGRSATAAVTVAAAIPRAVEDFEGSTTIFRGQAQWESDFSLNRDANYVRLGRGSGKLDYALKEERNFAAEWRTSSDTEVDELYTGLHMWVYGDGSGNELYFLYGSSTKGYLTQTVTTLDFTGWRQITVPVGGDVFKIQGLGVRAPSTAGVDGLIFADTPRSGTVYIDHITATVDRVPDNAVPAVTLEEGGGVLTGTVYDGADGVLPASSVSASYDGRAMEFTYDGGTGTLFAILPEADGAAHRVTVTARDGSGNIGRASVDIPAYGAERRFTDTAEYWGADYCDFLYDHGISGGYEDGTFRPDQKLTRLDFSVMLYNCLRLDPAKYAGVSLPFADLEKIPESALPALRALYAEGVVTGTQGKDGKLYFNPSGNLTRAQAAAMIGRSQEKGYALADLTFSDAGNIPAYAAFYIRTMAAQGIISGYSDNTFKPGNNITRGQMAKILYNLL